MKFTKTELTEKKFGRAFLVFAAVTFLSGCAFGQRIEYRGHSEFEVKIPNTPTVVAVIDQRPYVRSGNKSPQFVGLSRSLNGIPYGVSTTSGNPLAVDLAGMIEATLDKSGRECSSVALYNSQDRSELRKVLPASAAGDVPILLFDLYEWKTDAYFNTGFYYDVELSVLKGEDLASQVSVRKQGKDTLSAERPLNKAISELLAELLNSQKVVSQLSSVSTDLSASAAQTSASELQSKLNLLQKAKSDGLLTDEEYTAKRKKLVQDF